MCGWTRKRWKKILGTLVFKTWDIWSLGICFPFFRVAAYLKFELLDVNEKEKSCLGCENKLFSGTQWEQGTPSLSMLWVPEVWMQCLDSFMESRSNGGCQQQRQLSKKSVSYKWFEDWQSTLERNPCMPAFFFCSLLSITWSLLETGCSVR